MSQPYRVSFVCTGNICRSPMGEVILRELLKREGLADKVIVDSSGIQDWHGGNPADPRTIEALERGGYDGTAHRAHRLTEDEISDRDLLLVADRGHLHEVQRMAARTATPGDIRLVRDFDPDADKDELDDPYYGDEAGFDRCRDEVEAACRGVVDHLRELFATR